MPKCSRRRFRHCPIDGQDDFTRGANASEMQETAVGASSGPATAASSILPRSGNMAIASAWWPTSPCGHLAIFRLTMEGLRALLCSLLTMRGAEWEEGQWRQAAKAALVGRPGFGNSA